MKIYIESTLFISVIMNVLIIKTTSLLLKEKGSLCFLSSLLGAVATLFFPTISSNFAVKVFYIICVLNIMMLISFEYKTLKNFLIRKVVFLFCTFFYGGGALAIENIFGTLPVFIVTFIGAVIYLISAVIIKILHKAGIIKNFTYKIKIKDNGCEIVEEAFLDSGNMLYDSLTKKPIILIDFQLFNKLYKDISLENILTKTFDESSIKNGHYIKINSIGRQTNLLVFSIDEICVENEKRYYDVMTGLSLSGFERSFGKNILLHSELARGLKWKKYG